MQLQGSENWKNTHTRSSFLLNMYEITNVTNVKFFWNNKPSCVLFFIFFFVNFQEIYQRNLYIVLASWRKFIRFRASYDFFFFFFFVLSIVMNTLAPMCYIKTTWTEQKIIEIVKAYENKNQWNISTFDCFSLLCCASFPFSFSKFLNFPA